MFNADIALIGCFGHPNLGDELLLKCWIEEILRHQPKFKILVDCHIPGNVYAILGDYNGRVRYQDAIWRLAWDGPNNDSLSSLIDGFNMANINNEDISYTRFMLKPLTKVKLLHFIGGGIFEMVGLSIIAYYL